MTEFEDQLRRALERKEPSVDFTTRVMARATRAKRPFWWSGWQSWTAAAVAASLCLGLILETEHRRREEQQGEAAKAQLMQAMHITSAKLRQIHKKVQGEL
jgi:hypothetical protein